MAKMVYVIGVSRLIYTKNVGTGVSFGVLVVAAMRKYSSVFQSLKRLLTYICATITGNLTYLLYTLGIVDRWEQESLKAIKQLEALTGNTWENP